MSSRYFSYFTALLLVVTYAQAEAGRYTFHHENVLGTSLELQVDAPNAALATAAEQAALREIARLDGILSAYDPHSAFSAWQAGHHPAPLPQDLQNVLAASETWRGETGGAFNPAVEPAIRLWREAAATGHAPDAASIAQARQAIAGAPASLAIAAVPLTLDGLAKGYIIDQVCASVQAVAPEVEGLLINLGGDLRARGSLRVAVGIANPFADSETTGPIAHVPIQDSAVATSGNYQRFTEIAGRRISHILDPRTARPVSHIASATVVAPDTLTADALATALSVLPAEEGLAVAERIDGVACLLVASDGTVRTSSRWTAPAVARVPLAKAAAPQVSADGGATPWGETFELDIQFELANPRDSEEYRRPYVSIWICDAEGFPVRTLLLWYQRGGMRWLNSLRAWTRDDDLRYFANETDLAETISRATRPPGAYNVLWDGKDDDGAWVAPGTFTILIEAAREHGTHQLIKQPVPLAGTPFSQELEGNDEIARASLDFRRKAAK